MTGISKGFSLERMVSAVERVRLRLLKATATLERAQIPYAVAGGNAVAAWVTTVDEAAVRNTRDVDILLRRNDLEIAKSAFQSEGFVYRHDAGMDIFLDSVDAKARGAVYILFAGEKVRPEELLSNPDVADSVQADSYRILSLEALVLIKLTAFRDKDRTHLRDLLDVSLIDETWLERLPPSLAERLKALIDTPRG